jgi:hypothetical protein
VTRDSYGRYGFLEGIDFVTDKVFPNSGENPLGGRPAIEYHVSRVPDMFMVSPQR